MKVRKSQTESSLPQEFYYNRICKPVCRGTGYMLRQVHLQVSVDLI